MEEQQVRQENAETAFVATDTDRLPAVAETTVELRRTAPY
jgi:hypothetical protein